MNERVNKHCQQSNNSRDKNLPLSSHTSSTASMNKPPPPFISQKNIEGKRPPLPLALRNHSLEKKNYQTIQMGQQKNKNESSRSSNKRSLKPKIFNQSPNKNDKSTSDLQNSKIFAKIPSSKNSNLSNINAFSNIKKQQRVKNVIISNTNINTNTNRQSKPTRKSKQKDDTIQIKLVLVGDGSVGKTSMLISYTKNQFSIDYLPTIFQNYTATVKCNNKIVKLGLWDTAGQQQYARLRPLSYNKTDIFLICFSMMDNVSLDNAIDKWLVQINQNCPNTYKIFVGTKSDLRRQHDMMCQYKNQLNKMYTKQEIQKRINYLGYQFMQCSALDQKGLNDVFTQGMMKVMKKYQIKKQQPNAFCNLI